MKILAFDTSNQALSLAVLEEDQLLANLTFNIKKNHSITLMPTIDFLMNQLDLKPKDLDRIVVAHGPGSYTGLRIAVATAKVLASTLKIDLVGVSSLQALIPFDTKGIVVPIIDARRNNVYVGFYKNDKLIEAEGHKSLEEVLTYLSNFDLEEEVTFVGQVENFKSQILERLPQVKFKETLPSAHNIGILGKDLPSDDIDSFVPNYLKRVEAEENWLKSHNETDTDYIEKV